MRYYIESHTFLGMSEQSVRKRRNALSVDAPQCEVLKDESDCKTKPQPRRTATDNHDNEPRDQNHH